MFTVPLLICYLAALKNFLIFLKTWVFADSITCRACNGDGISAQCCHNFFNLCTYLQLLLSARLKSEQWSWAFSHQDTKHLKNFWILSCMKQQLGTRRGIYWNLLVVNLGIVKFCWYWSSVNTSHQLTAVWYMNCNCVLLLVKTICSPSRGGGAKQKIVMVGE